MSERKKKRGRVNRNLKAQRSRNNYESKVIIALGIDIRRLNAIEAVFPIEPCTLFNRHSLSPAFNPDNSVAK